MTVMDHESFTELIAREINSYKCPYFSVKTLMYSLKEHPIANDPSVNFNRKCSRVFIKLKEKGYIVKWNICSGHSTYKKLKQIPISD